MNSVNTDRIRKKPWLIGTIVLGFVSIACGIIFPAQEKAPPQGWLESRGAVVPHDSFPDDCSLCHIADGWHNIVDDFQFDHFLETGTPLNGAHFTAECLRCHNDRGPVGLFAQRGCEGCHIDVHSSLLGFNCNDCHGEDNWQPKAAIVQHNNDTRFPLVGAHAGVACFRCHEGAHIGNFRRASTRCESCHQTALAAATNPDHVANGWIQDCQRCHRPTSWGGRGFTHSTFPLTGAHTSTACTNCHIGGVFAGTPRNCVGCHQTDYNTTTNPNHQASNFSTTCTLCHNTTTWSGALFDHTQFPLTGVHSAVACAQCHQGGVFQGTPNTCVGCHLNDFNNTTNPNHQASGFSTNCIDCHNTAMTWAGANFDHSQFPLTGAHSPLACAQCHQGGVFQGTPNTCVGCHQNDFNNTTNPNHQASGFSTDCLSCHNTNMWQGAVFNHRFPLRGPHNVSCSTCHTVPGNNQVFNCLGCHEHRQSRMNDKHSGVGGYVYSSPACVNCHPNGRK